MRKITVFLVTCFFSLGVFAADPYKIESIMLLQPDWVMRERASDVKAFAAYINGIKEAANKEALQEAKAKPSAGYIIAAVRPSGKSKIWLDFSPPLSKEMYSKLEKAIEAVPPLNVQGGVVVFAINSTLWGASPIQRSPNPEEWSKVERGLKEPMEIGALMDRVWP
jgi:hypothetical protein